MDEDEGEYAYLSDSEAEIRPAHAVFTLGPEFDPIPMHLHNSLGRGGQEAIAKKIRSGGGDPTAVEDDAEVIICRDDHPAFAQLEHKYDHYRYVWVEAPSWVDMCLRRKRYEHILPGRSSAKNGARARVDFTPDDDKHLMEYLAARIPFKEARGRNGNGVYKDLVDPDRAHLYPWAKRHPWMSWRERYVKSSDIFDSAIARLVKKDPDPPKLGGKGQYHIRRKPKKNHLRHTVELDDEEEDGSDELQEDGELEAETDGEVPKQVARDRSRPKLETRRRRTERSHSSPPRKRARVVISSDSEEDIERGIGPSGNKGKDRQDADPGHASPDERFESVYEFAMDEPGPSQFAGARINDPNSSPRTASANVEHGLQASSSRSNAAVSKHMPHPPPPVENRYVSERPPDSQKTIVGGLHTQHDPRAALTDTQATLRPSSPPRTRSSRSDRGVSNIPQRETYPNTRSRPRPLFEQPVPIPPVGKRGRGRPRRAQPSGAIPHTSLLATGEPSRQMGPPPSIVPPPDEARVEALLRDKSTGERGDAANDRSDGDSASRDDQEAERELLAGQRNLVDREPSSTPRISEESRPVKSISSKNPPQIDLNTRARAGSTSRKATLLRPTVRGNSPQGARDTDTNSALNSQVHPRGAKKTAARNAPSYSGMSDGDEQSPVPTETTTSSFPAEVTNAWEFKTANSPFTPGPGTRAEQYTQRTSRKGKRRAE